ncbi:hypothetical protein FOS14_07105 [Skermania sp. ID1734]|uniref:neutral zinc metallopeptidase n=1 Tax=Skermania sp. ID1734 TaxID=2597516 RepID=UPI00117E357D|nr:neutral zinc metallopeptidase [Skermania sp. ID1734]TSE00771.1 hypothetical protein FOS14_07105 [Skermania sp. ID1734]
MSGSHRQRHLGPSVAVLVVALVAFIGLIIAVRVMRSDGTERVGETSTASDHAVVVTTALAQSAAPSVTATTTQTTATTTTPADPLAPMAANPLSSAVQSVARRGCPLPPWISDPVAMQQFLQAALACLDTAWQPVLAALKVPFQPARVALGGVAGDDCGRPPERNSFYCAGTIYLDPASFLGTNAGPQAVPAAAVGLLAHEYGHHLQQLSGLLPAVVTAMNEAGRQSPLGLEESRRTELQAQCLAGMFIGASFDAGSVRLAQQDNWSRGDQPGSTPDHGQPANFGMWFTRGVDRDSLDVCNTWTAPASSVS